MKNIECLKTALWNVRAFKKTGIKIVTGFSTVILLLFCITAYRAVFGQQVRKIEKDYRTECYLETDINSDNWADYKKEISDIEQQCAQIGCQEGSVLTSLTVRPKKGNTKKKKKKSEDVTVNTQICHASLDIDGRNYAGKSEILAGIRPENHFWNTDTVMTGLWQPGFRPFPHSVTETVDGSSWLTGNLPEHPGEVLISDYLLGEFGIAPGDQKKMIGKRISLHLDGEQYTPVKDYVLAGIFRADVLEKREKHTFASHMQQLYVNIDETSEQNFDISGGVVRYYADNFEQLLVCREKAADSDQEIHLSLYGAVYDTMSGQVSAINGILEYIILGFAFAVTVYLLCVLYFFFQQNNTFTSMLRAIGMRDADVGKIIFSELLIFSLTALGIGIYAGMFVLYGLKYLYDYVGLLKFEYSVPVLSASAVWAFLYCVLVSGCYGIFYLARQKKENIAERLNCD